MTPEEPAVRPSTSTAARSCFEREGTHELLGKPNLNLPLIHFQLHVWLDEIANFLSKQVGNENAQADEDQDQTSRDSRTFSKLVT
jgi:hypothetical protein